MKLYISGPMTGIADHNFPAFMAAEQELRAAGHDVVNPAALQPAVEGKTWAEYMREDLRALLGCDGVAFLPGWGDSRGATLEHHVAAELGLPCRFVVSWVLRAERAKEGAE